MKELDAFEYIERDDEGDESFYVLYAGEGLSQRYPEDWYFWMWLPKPKIWERHAIDKRAELRQLDDNDKQQVLKAIFLAEDWIISV